MKVVSVDVAVTCRRSDVLDDWYTIERVEHDGRMWSEPTRYGSRLCLSSRLEPYTCVEGTPAEMARIANAIRQGDGFHAKRCAVEPDEETTGFLLWSPRNSEDRALVSREHALQLATDIEALLGRGNGNPSASEVPEGLQ